MQLQLRNQNFVGKTKCNQFSFRSCDCSHLRSRAPPPPPCGGHQPAGQGASRSGPQTPGSPCTLRVRRSAWAGCCTCSSQRRRCTAHLQEKNRLSAGNLSVRNRLTNEAKKKKKKHGMEAKTLLWRVHTSHMYVCVCVYVWKLKNTNA